MSAEDCTGTAINPGDWLFYNNRSGGTFALVLSVAPPGDTRTFLTTLRGMAEYSNYRNYTPRITRQNLLRPQEALLLPDCAVAGYKDCRRIALEFLSYHSIVPLDEEARINFLCEGSTALTIQRKDGKMGSLSVFPAIRALLEKP